MGAFDYSVSSKAREGAAVQASATDTTRAAITGTRANGFVSNEAPVLSASEPNITAAISNAPASTMPTVHQRRFPVPHKAEEAAAAPTHATMVIQVEGVMSMPAARS